MHPPLRNCGVLQIEPTDFCNLACPMCHPQQGNRPNLHGELLKGYMDMALYRRIIAGIAESDVCFDHVIFQWLGDPSLHPGLLEMLDHALRHIGERAGYFRIDTNAILLGAERVDQLVRICERHPGAVVLLVFSLDAISRQSYRVVKGRDHFDTVMANVQGFLERRGAMAVGEISLNAEFQFVLQAGNAHELVSFVEHWDGALAVGERGRGHNSIMVKRLSVGTGGQRQQAADRLYTETVRAAGLRPFRKPHVELKLWSERPWDEHDDPAAAR